MLNYRNFHPAIKINAIVPGSIYSDLRRAKVLGNIYQDINDVKYRWVAYDNWTYEYTFDGIIIIIINQCTNRFIRNDTAMGVARFNHCFSQLLLWSTLSQLWKKTTLTLP